MADAALRRIGFALLVLLGAGVAVAVALSFVPDRSVELGTLGRIQHNLGTLLTFDYGRAVQMNVPISTLLWDRALNSLMLIGGALVVMAGVGVPLGLGRALRPESRVLSVAASLLHALSSIPILVWAFGLLVLASGLFGTAPNFTNLDQVGGLDALLIIAVPIAALGLGDGMLSDIIRNVRTEAQREMDETYIRALQARQVPVARHLWRGVVAPTVAALAGKAVYLVSGTILVEYIFDVPGLGLEIYQSIVNVQDYPVVIAATMLLVVFTVTLNLISEFVALSADPRLRAS